MQYWIEWFFRLTFGKFRKHSQYLATTSANLGHSLLHLHLVEIFAIFRQHFIKILFNAWHILLKKLFETFIFELAKTSDEFLLKCWALSGANELAVCTPCRSRQERSLFLNLPFEPDPYSSEYLFATIGVDTAENGPLKVAISKKF